jgi:3-hydroxyisobutyrate dehydrogenase-like beta-hydroxyacid dehydrogenase
MKIGFIGLGQMRAGMAASLLKAGHEVTAYDRTQAKAAALVPPGARIAARIAASVADACRGETVMTMLASDRAVVGSLAADDAGEPLRRRA